MISYDKVKNIAKLARLGIKESENAKFQKEISSILDYFKMLQDIDTSKIEPTFHSTEEFIERTEIMRKDKAVPLSEDSAEELINSAPDKEKRYIKVKAVL